MPARDRSCPAGGCLVLILTLKDVRNVTLSYSKLVFITIKREREKEGHICVIQQKKIKMDAIDVSVPVCCCFLSCRRRHQKLVNSSPRRIVICLDFLFCKKKSFATSDLIWWSLSASRVSREELSWNKSDYTKPWEKDGEREKCGFHVRKGTGDKQLNKYSKKS